jgi:hypothetical protein
MSNKILSANVTISNSLWLNIIFAMAIILFSLLLPPLAHAHRGPANEIDDCRIRVGPEIIHFTAYTPTFTQSNGYCQQIPNIGPTNLVFDYEGHKLRNVTVEFEITKEPEGTRIFYKQPKKIKTGTINALVDFSKYGAGDYLAHVTIMHEGEKQDTHLPFAIGVEVEASSSLMKILLPALFIVTILIVMMVRRPKSNTDQQE